MASTDLFSFDEFVSSNKPKRVGSLDYLHALFKLGGLPIDLLYCSLKLFMPDLRDLDGHVFLKESFDIDIYNQYLNEGKSISEIQLWINIVEVTSIFGDLEEDKAVVIASSIAQMWNHQIAAEVPDGVGKARVIHDKEQGEIFVTID